MIPLSDENPSRTVPYITFIILALNVLVYIADVLNVQAVQYWSMIPFSAVNDIRIAPIFDQMGRFVTYQPLPGVGPHPQWLTVFTSMFMHGGFMHIAGNMLYLWIFGNNIEDALGHFKFLLFYIAVGVLAALAHVWSTMGTTGAFIPTVGASGAIAGVLGAYLLLYPGNSVRTLITLPFYWDYVEIPAIYVLGAWFVLQLTNVAGSGGSQGGGVAYWAHIGGFVAGVILIWLLGGKSLAAAQRGNRPRRDGRLSRWDG